jgi:hypothetical protein
VQHGAIREPHHAVSGRGQDRFTLCIVVPLRRMDRAIELDREATFGAAEVDHKWANRMLPAELQPIQATTAQFFPQEVLSRRLASPQVSCRGDVLPVSKML